MEITHKRLLALLIMVVVVIFSWWPSLRQASCEQSTLCVVFLNVGQGDATFIQTPSGAQVLVDGGRGSDVLRELAVVMGFWDRQLDMVIITHPDADHVGGLVDIFDRYQVDVVVRTENESDTPAWQAIAARIEAEESEVMYARRGQSLISETGVSLEVLFPDRDMSETESNTASIVTKLTHGDISFLLTGDAPKSIEEYLVLIEGADLQSDVLKIGHHGSRTSTSELFLNEVRPTYGVVSAGKDNQYGHPHVEVTDALFNAGIETYSTAEDGNVIFWSDGVSVTVRH